ncbi:MAG: deoxyribodipyrimidine photo-lyase [Bacteroidales bacterium]|jgi:deoxyribodipyrimidine photo-lyase|nr:deoxyribodipyrimidine photo-lyase [Bacteroidales bacterium]
MAQQIVLFWFRRDLRLHDNLGLCEALSSGKKVLPLFIFDTEILNLLPDTKDRRVDLLLQIITRLHTELKTYKSSIQIEHGKPEEIFQRLFSQHPIAAVYTNRDYEPFAKERDKKIAQLCAKHHIAFHSYKNQVIFESEEILTQQGNPYTVYTPYSRTWRSAYEKGGKQNFDSTRLLHNLTHRAPQKVPKIQDIGFQDTGEKYTKYTFPKEIIHSYEKNRDFPGIDGTSKIGFHLRFGTVSIREVVAYANKHNAVWLQELIWRDFFSGILDTFPHVVHSCFKDKYNELNWRNNEEEFEQWCAGQTGYPIVDAGMRELNASGWMHNRVRMITASFLCKHLCIDWRWGEAYFASKLLDYELASNNGNWQWAASTGCDAVPYFRIFNPYTQQQKFDPDETYIRRHIPEYGTNAYPKPMVDHTFARKRALQMYKEV